MTELLLISKLLFFYNLLGLSYEVYKVIDNEYGPLKQINVQSHICPHFQREKKLEIMLAFCFGGIF